MICTFTIINTSYQKLPFGSGDCPDKLFYLQYGIRGVLIFKATEGPSGICCWLGARRRFAKYTNDLEIEYVYGICK